MSETQKHEQVKNVEMAPSSEMLEQGFESPMISRSPMDLPVEGFTQALNRREENRKALVKWIQDNLVQGVDFGRIHVAGKEKCSYAREERTRQCDNKYHWSKPSLWKPGAEKICGMLGLVPRFPNLKEYEHAVLRGEDIRTIILKCELNTPSGFVAAEGTGARRVAQDKGDINKSLKMSEKSAHIDATLRVAGLSEIFTQDLEDMVNEDKGQASIQHDAIPSEDNEQTGEDHAIDDGSRTGIPEGGNGGDSPGNGSSQKLTGKQYNYILKLWEETGRSTDELDARCVEVYGASTAYLTRRDASSLIERLLKKSAR